MRIPFFAGNWKMNNTKNAAVNLVSELRDKLKGLRSQYAVCVPFTDIEAVQRAAEGSRIGIGAQNIAWADKGAFTGEISAAMLAELGVGYVIIGHSERRQYFGETDRTVAMRTQQALKNNFVPIVCIGETEAERMAAKTDAVNERQLRSGLEGITADEAKRLIIAYEPVWAIGTGKTATKEDANDAIAFIRKVFAGMFGADAASMVRILYGGSMNAKNSGELMSMPEIDGGLIGSASLSADDFFAIVNSGEQKFV